MAIGQSFQTRLGPFYTGDYVWILKVHLKNEYT